MIQISPRTMYPHFYEVPHPLKLFIMMAIPCPVESRSRDHFSFLTTPLLLRLPLPWPTTPHSSCPCLHFSSMLCLWLVLWCYNGEGAFPSTSISTQNKYLIDSSSQSSIIRLGWIYVYRILLYIFSFSFYATQGYLLPTTTWNLRYFVLKNS